MIQLWYKKGGLCFRGGLRFVNTQNKNKLQNMILIFFFQYHCSPILNLPGIYQLYLGAPVWKQEFCFAGRQKNNKKTVHVMFQAQNGKGLRDHKLTFKGIILHCKCFSFYASLHKLRIDTSPCTTSVNDNKTQQTLRAVCVNTFTLWCGRLTFETYSPKEGKYLL